MRAEPDVVIHEMTGLTGMTSLRNFDTAFALTNRLRTEGTDHLLEAAQAAGARRFIAQSFGNWNFERTGSAPKTEDDPLDPDPPAKQRVDGGDQALGERRNRRRGTGPALRSYGLGNGISEDGEMAEMVRKRRSADHRRRRRRVVVHTRRRRCAIRDGRGHRPRHARDLQRRRRQAGRGPRLEPPALARALHAPAPRRVPVWLGRLASGDVGVSLMTSIRGASNEKAKRELGWRPRYPSYREGFRDGLGYPSRVGARA